MKKYISVKVKPGSKKREVKIDQDGLFHVQLMASPEKGRANEELVEVLSEYFKIPKSRIRLKKGHTSRIKLIEIDMV